MDHELNPSETAPGDPASARIDAAWGVDRSYLVRVASRILGGDSEAEDVVQEAFGRLGRVDLDDIDDLRGWLAVVVRHLALDRVRSAHARHETAVGSAIPDDSKAVTDLRVGDPADRITLDDQVRLALAVVFDRLTPAERTSFVLHDVFGFPFTDVGLIVGRTATACRQLASRARRSIRSQPNGQPRDAEVTSHQVLTERFIAACAGGDMAALMAVLDPDVVGVATLIDHGPIVRLEGHEVVARRIVALFGPGSTRSLVPLAVEDRPAVVALDGDRVAAVIVLDEVNGLIHHIETFIRPLRAKSPRRVRSAR